jgi:hypothetical protein
MEILLKEKLTAIDIAKRLGRHRRTIEKKITKGKLQRSSLSFFKLKKRQTLIEEGYMKVHAMYDIFWTFITYKLIFVLLIRLRRYHCAHIFGFYTLYFIKNRRSSFAFNKINI